MRAAALKYPILSLVATFVMVILLLLPFHAFLTVSFSSFLGHYTALRLWKEVLVLIAIFGVVYLLLTDGKIRSHTLTRRLVWVVLLYIVYTIARGLWALQTGEVELKALAYGWLSALRFPIFFLITWAIALRLSRLRKSWQQLVLWPAAVVIIFGLLQAFVLPRDFLVHFGYGPTTIDPISTINDNADYVRISSTLRGPNPLGAYLLIPLSLLAVLLASGKRNWQYLTLTFAGLIVLFFSFSRSAWLGGLLTLGVIVMLQLKAKRTKEVAAIALLIVLLIGSLITISLRNNPRFQNLVFHTETNSQVAKSSNDDRYVALSTGMADVATDPLGDGPGAAGPASVYNENHPVQISENYYLQIGQETGWLGLLLFLVMMGGVGYLLWLRRSDPLALSLLASFVGLAFINLLSHAWADDTLAYIWWGLAGVAMASLPGDEVKGQGPESSRLKP